MRVNASRHNTHNMGIGYEYSARQASNRKQPLLSAMQSSNCLLSAQLQKKHRSLFAHVRGRVSHSLHHSNLLLPHHSVRLPCGDTRSLR